MAHAQLVQITQVSQPPRPACATKDLRPPQKMRVELAERPSEDPDSQKVTWRAEIPVEAVRQRWNNQREVCEFRLRLDESTDCWRWNRWRDSQSQKLSCEDGEIWLSTEAEWAEAPRAAGERSATSKDHMPEAWSKANSKSPTSNARPRLDDCGLKIARRQKPQRSKSALARQACVDRGSRVWRSENCTHKVCEPSLAPPVSWPPKADLASGLCKSFGGQLAVFLVHPQPLPIESCEFGNEQFMSPSLILDRLSFSTNSSLQVRLIETPKK